MDTALSFDFYFRSVTETSFSHLHENSYNRIQLGLSQIEADNCVLWVFDLKVRLLKSFTLYLSHKMLPEFQLVQRAVDRILSLTEQPQFVTLVFWELH